MATSSPFRASMVALLVATSLAIVGPAAAVVCVSTPAGLLARWPGNGSTNEVAHNRDGTLVGGATYAAGQAGQAFAFDGAGDLVTVPDNPDWTLVGDFTIDAWVNIDGGGGGESMVFVAQSQGKVAPKWMFWWRDDGQLGFMHGDGSGGVDAVMYPWSPTLGQWYHVAVTRAENTFTLYVDGATVATAEATPPIAETPDRSRSAVHRESLPERAARRTRDLPASVERRRDRRDPRPGRGDAMCDHPFHGHPGRRSQGLPGRDRVPAGGADAVR